jgi:oligopeptide transport system substrate-binding protein
VPVTAGDFVTAWRRTLAPATRAPGADYLLVIKGARAFHAHAGGSGSTTADLGVCAIDDQTLEVELEEPTGHFLQVLVRPETYPAPRHALATHGDAWAAPKHIITNGPFRLAEWRPGERVTLARNRGHYGEAHTQGNVEQVELLPLTSVSERLAAYDAGALDILGISFFPPEERARAQRTHPGEAIARPILETCYLVFDVTRPPFDDARVRRALALATDREALVDEALEGDAVAAMGGLLPQGMPGHSPDIGPPHDPEAAQRLLAEAGYPDGAGFPAVRALGFAAIAPRATFLQTQWRQILSIDVAWETPDWTSFLEGMGKEIYGLTAYLWVADYPDPDAFLHLSRAATWANWHNEAFEGLVENARRTLDQEERVELYRRAERLLMAEAPILPLTYEMEHLLIKPWVNRYPTAPSRAVFWQDVVIEDH